MSERMTMTMPKMDGHEIRPGIYLIGEPTPIPGTNKMTALADYYGALALVEIVMRFAADGDTKGSIRGQAPSGV
jgi:hypothetical protein